MNDQGPSLESGPADQPLPPAIAQPGADPFTQLAPGIPGLDAPDVVIEPTPGTAAQLARHNALRAAPRQVGIMLAITVPASTIALLVLGLPWEPMLVIEGVIVAYVLVSLYFSLRRQFRSLSRSDVAGGGCAVVLGADALDLAEDGSRTRIGYDRLRSVTASRGVVTLSYDNRHAALPRALFPDPLLTELRRIVDGESSTRSPLPPLPRLPHPQVHTVIAADTARRLTIARRLEPWRRTTGLLAIAVLLVEAVAFGGIVDGVTGALSALLVAVLFALTVRFWMRRPSENALRQYQGMFPAASGFAAQFGSDAVVLAGATFLLRAPFSIVT